MASAGDFWLINTEKITSVCKKWELIDYRSVPDEQKSGGVFGERPVAALLLQRNYVASSYLSPQTTAPHCSWVAPWFPLVPSGM